MNAWMYVCNGMKWERGEMWLADVTTTTATTTTITIPPSEEGPSYVICHT